MIREDSSASPKLSRGEILGMSVDGRFLAGMPDTAAAYEPDDFFSHVGDVVADAFEGLCDEQDFHAVSNGTS